MWNKIFLFLLGYGVYKNQTEIEALKKTRVSKPTTKPDATPDQPAKAPETKEPAKMLPTKEPDTVPEVIKQPIPLQPRKTPAP